MRYNQVLWNTTGYLLEVKAEGVEYRIEPFGMLEDFYSHTHFAHIKNKKENIDRGIVTLEFNAKDREKYKNDFDSYRKAQEISGLMAALKSQEQIVRDNQNANDAAKNSKESTPTDRVLTKNVLRASEEKLENIRKWLEEAQEGMELVSVVEEKRDTTVTERPKWEKKAVAKEKPENATVKHANDSTVLS